MLAEISRKRDDVKPIVALRELGQDPIGTVARTIVDKNRLDETQRQIFILELQTHPGNLRCEFDERIRSPVDGRDGGEQDFVHDVLFKPPVGQARRPTRSSRMASQSSRGKRNPRPASIHFGRRLGSGLRIRHDPRWVIRWVITE